jgi:2-iminobutanoate/2-iminopropanoate deaminase
MNHRAMLVQGLPAPGGAYSHVTKGSGLVWTAGFGPQDPDSGTIPDGVEEQTRATLANVARALAAVDLDLSNVTKTTVYLAELERDFAAFNRVYADTVPQPYPVRTTVGAQLLGILVEMDVVATSDE